jgi:MoaA/NifB/PqqE/SkfB family radical SAM enzyme
MNIYKETYERVYKEILQRLGEWATGGRASPVRMVTLPTNRCDLDCIFCGGVLVRQSPEFTSKDELPTEEWVRIAKEATRFGVREWLIGGGGEPFMRAGTVIAMVSTIKRMNPQSVIEISTNGTLFSHEAARQLVRWGCDQIQFGVDGPTAQIHDFLRGVDGTFERVTSAIRYLAEVKAKLGRQKPIIKMHIVLNSMNYDKLPEMVRLASNLGVNHFAAAAMRVDDGNRSRVERAGLRLNDEQKNRIHKIWKKVEKIATNLNINLGPVFCEGMEEVSKTMVYKSSARFRQKSISRFLAAFCFAPFYSLIVDWAGNVGPCACGGSIHNPTNNLHVKSIEEVWYGDFFKSVRDCMLRGDPIHLDQLIPLPEQKPEGLPINPCESCGINLERQRLAVELPKFIEEMLSRG